VLNLVKYRFAFIIFSLLIIVPGTIALAIFGFNVGIDFAGGSSIEFRPQKAFSSTAEVENYLKPLNLRDVQITFGENKALAGDRGEKTVWVRLNTQIDSNVFNSIKTTLQGKYPKANVQQVDVPIAGSTPITVLTLTGFDSSPKTSDIQGLLSKLPNTGIPTSNGSTAQPSNPANIPVKVVQVVQGTTVQTVRVLTSTPIDNKANSDEPKIQALFLEQKGPYLQFTSISSVGGSVASETTRNSILAVAAASVFILLYIWFSFRKVAKAWRYGTCAIIAMLHDVLVVLGIMAFLGKFFGIQIDALFITGLLTVVGFSVHDTIVVFDRTRENMQRRTSETFEQVVNASLIQTMARSLNTSLTVIFTLLALTLFSNPGTSVHTFTLVLLIGMVSGTFSSIFTASMLLVIWENGEMGFGWFDRNRNLSPSKRETRELARTRG